MTQPAFYTPAEIAAMLRVSKMTIYRLIYAGEIDANRVGKSFRIDARDVHAFLRDSSTATDGTA